MNITDHQKMMQMHRSGQGSMPGMKKVSYHIALKAKHQIAENTMEFIFEKPLNFAFKAGQHVRMTLIDPPETDTEGNSRFLTIASIPQESDLRFAVRMRDTAFKRTLKQMESGQKVLIQILLDVPHGAFTLHDDESKPAVFLVGGIGIVPAYAMIRDSLYRKTAHTLYLFYSNRRPEDAAYLDELQLLAKKHRRLIFIPTMTDMGNLHTEWRGETRRVDEALLRKYIKDLRPPIYYIAGLPAMASSMQQMITEAGVDEDSIRMEQFSGFNLNQLRSSTGRPWLGYAILGLAAIVVISIVLAHTGMLGKLSHADITSFSLGNPLVYPMVALLLAIVTFKIFVIVRVKRILSATPGKPKLTAQTILDAHRIRKG